MLEGSFTETIAFISASPIIAVTFVFFSSLAPLRALPIEGASQTELQTTTLFKLDGRLKYAMESDWQQTKNAKSKG